MKHCYCPEKYGINIKTTHCMYIFQSIKGHDLNVYLTYWCRDSVQHQLLDIKLKTWQVFQSMTISQIL